MGVAASREAVSRKALALVMAGEVDALGPLLTREHADVNAFFQTDEWGSNTLLYYAVIKQHHAVTKLLLEAGARVDIHDRYGRTPLHDAVVLDDAYLVSLLLTHGADANAAYHREDTPLFYAISGRVVELLAENGADVQRPNDRGESALVYALTRTGSEWEVVASLLSHGADINRVDEEGNNALHTLAKGSNVQDDMVERLVAVGTQVNGRNQRGETPLHVAVQPDSVADDDEDQHFVSLLLAAGSDVQARDKNGHQPLHAALVVAYKGSRGRITSSRMCCLQLLVAHGAPWDPLCEKLVEEIANTSSALPEKDSSRESVPLDIAQAVRLCIQHWMGEYTMQQLLTEVPEEEVNRGFEATKTYLSLLAKSDRVVLRRMISVVGPSNWGKTSLVKSLVSDEPSLVHPNDRTIGIDKYKLSFDQQVPSAGAVVLHEVTFWDFAGQDEYQVAHALFFSRRALYLVCIDLKAYAITFMQALLMTDDAAALDLRMNWYVEIRILRWIRLIIARQPDAEFRFVGTKNDLVRVADEDALDDLQIRLRNVLVIVSHVKRSQEITDQSGQDVMAITHLGDVRLASMQAKPTVDLMISSSAGADSVIALKKWIIHLISNSRRSYRMPDSYSNVLRMVKHMRVAAAAMDPSRRIQACFANADKLIDELTKKIDGISHDECRVILQALRDLGDVLWYDDFDDATLRETVILDPMLLIDFIRQIFNHNEKSEVMRHALLQELRLWKNLDRIQMLAMKRVLQYFHLAYPTEKEMQADSDLLMPAFWRSKKSAQWLFLGQPLKHPSTAKPRDWRVTVHWEIHVEYGFEDVLFDRLVVASYNSSFSRVVGPDYILYGDIEGVKVPYALRLIADWHRTTHKRVLHLEAVLGDEAKAAAALWARFECVCVALAAVFKTFPGLRVSSCARQPSEKEGGEDDRPLLRTCTTPDPSWLPPEPTLTTCRELLTT